jgi:Concanavalin A-like lectin/glucanases superfamily
VYLLRQAIATNHPEMVFQTYADGSPVTDAAGQPVPIVNETLLVDRFVLSGSELLPKMEVRYKRSRSKFRPDGSKDSLGARDMEKNPFFEPTQELDFIRNLTDGRFTALLLPTQVSGIQRWQFFAHNAKTDLIDSFNVERSGDGLFNTRGTTLYTSPDPDYQSSVLERQPGTCPFTGLELVPAISQSGYSESALAFDGKSTIADFGNILSPAGDGFTVELWFRCDRVEGMNTLFSKGTMLAASVVDGVLNYAWQPGEAVVVDAFEVNPETWYHLAITYDGHAQRVYKDGFEVYSQDLPGAFGTSKAAFVLGAQSKSKYFQGQLDEVRVWQRSRSLSELKADRSQRLVGNEPGLAAYWRCDEGSGDRLYDQTDFAHHGSIKGSVAWVSSEAPVGDRIGIRRSSIKLEGRAIVSGLSALLYYQQETAASGYDGVEKPVKKNARVMLALNTQAIDGDNSPNPDELGHISVVDFALSREGKLALTPDRLALPPLTPDRDGGSLNEQIETIRNLEHKIGQLRPEVRTLTDEVAALNAEILALENSSNRIAALEPEIATLERTLAHYNRPLYATFYEHGGYGGASFQMQVGESKSWVGDWWNDRISSIKWDSSDDMKIEIFQHSNYGGRTMKFPALKSWKVTPCGITKAIPNGSLMRNAVN